MTRDVLLSVFALLVGVTMAALGAWAYVGKTAEGFFRRSWDFGGMYFGPASTMFLLPAGVGFTLMGIAFLVGKNAVTTEILIAGLAFVLVGWLLFFIHPAWIRPKWMRSKHATRSMRRR